MSKILFAASSGGHLDEILQLREITRQYSCVLFTEKTDFDADFSNFRTTYFVPQMNRKEFLMPLKLLRCALTGIRVLIKERPGIIISTGVLATVPLCMLGKLTGVKIIYIESFAKVYSPTKTGKLLYRIADRFYVQWESMIDTYPNAIYAGGIY